MSDNPTAPMPAPTPATDAPAKPRKPTDPVPWNEITFPETNPIKIPGKPSDDEGEDAHKFLDEELPVILGQYEWLRAREDDPSAPFNSRYSGRDKLASQRERLLEFLGAPKTTPEHGATFPSSGPLRLLHALAMVSQRIGSNYIETEEMHSGQTYIDYCIEHFSRHVETFPIELMDTYNQLGILWSNREEFPKSEQYLLKAKKHYHDLIEGEKTKKMFLESMTPQERELHIDQLTLSESVAMERVEELYTLNAFFLAQIYGHMGKAALSAEYCQVCLERQLQKFDTLNVVDFGHNCIGLYNYYSVAERFPQAEYYLHAAMHVINKAKTASPQSKTYLAVESSLPQAIADLHKNWGKFYAHLLKLGWSFKSGQRKGSYDTASSTASLTPFPGLPKFTLISVALPTTFEQALKYFKLGESELNQAKEYYLLDGWVTDHLDILQDMAQMYTTLAHFETDGPRKCKMLKRKINLFESIISELNPRVYVDNVRNLAFEIAETYQAIADLKAQYNEDGHAQKINELCFKAAKFLKMLLKTFEVPGAVGGVEVSEPWMPVFISGHLAMARLHTKFIYPDQAQQVKEQEAALDTYQKVVAFIKRTPNADKSFALEMRMCQEMCELLPLKIAAIRAGKGDLLRRATGTST